MTVKEILIELESLGSEQTKKILQNHGAGDKTLGVKIEDLKKIQKKIQNNHELALELYDSGVYDAMYLAGLISEPQKMTKEDLQKWAENSNSSMLSEYIIAWVSAESKYGFEIADLWIKSDKENVASSGWATLSSLCQLVPDEQLNIPKIIEYLDFIRANIHKTKNRVSYTMNMFVICAGSGIKELYDYAFNIGEEIGKVKVEMGGTACKVPYTPEYLKKMQEKGYIGKKRKTAFC